MRNPNLFILGVQKCGTSTLAAVLSSHPDIFLPSVKETYFFCDERRYLKGVDWYLHEFYSARKARRATLLADATPFYLASPEALQRIVAFVGPAARFIVILRDPVERAYSAYWHQQRLESEPLSFEQALDAEPGRIANAREAGERWWRCAYAEVGRYGTHLRRACDLLGRERLLVLTERALIDTERSAVRISEHLGLRTPLAWTPQRTNRASMPRLKWLQRAVIRDCWLKQSWQRLVPREMRSALGRRILRLNARSVAYPPMPGADQRRLAAVFANEIAVLRDLGAVEPWCLPDLEQWPAFLVRAG